MILFLSIILEILLSFILKNIINVTDISIFLIILNLIIAYINILMSKYINKSYKTIIIISLTIRIIMLFIDQFVYSLPNSDNHGDSGGYNRAALMISENPKLILESNKDIYGGLYSKIIGVLYFFTGNQRLFVQSINCFLAILIICIVGKILDMCKNLKYKHKVIIMLIVAFFPQGIMLSAILHRETLIALCVTLSLFYCIKSLKSNRIIEKILSILFVLLASMFHAGVIALIIGYILVYSFFSVRYRAINNSITRKMLFLFLCLGLVFIYLHFGDVIATKLTNLDTDTLADTMERNRGGSAYLTNIQITGINSMIIYSIPKTIYFILSPMPWDWRSLSDIITFFADSLIYAFFIGSIFKLILKTKEKTFKRVILFLLIGILVSIIIFGIGTFTAAAAMRHRHKLFYAIVIIYILLADFNTNNKNNERKEVNNENNVLFG